ncbi:MAG TPA: DUF1549 domain-containing protein, partial [Planctomycetaceae bacterium]
MSGHSCGTIVCLAAVVLTSAPVSAEGPDDQRRLEFFETRIRPVLIEHCYECHSAASDPPQGNLRLDHRDGLLAGGDSGPAVAPGEPADSVLIQALRYDGYEMPPSGRLPEAVVRDFEKWVRDGAFDPRDEPPAAAAAETAAPETDHWAYRPPRRHDPPDVADAAWSADPIDRFVLARLEAAGLRPAPEADRATVIRRLTFDLTGLPPTPEEIDAYLADHRPDAYERLVDRLLARPEFGERWGRHWLDVARYAESVTLRGLVFGEAWRYRDYVIDAFDRDVPFDRFVKEQIAGDLLPAATPTDRERQIVATTYLVLGNTNLEEQDKSQLRMDVVDEQL